MIICRTPYRVSFFGGGTDFPGWYRANGGSVLSTSIDKYCYLTVRYLPPFFEHRIRVVWSKIENCKTIDEVTHPAVREVVKNFGITRCLEIHHVGDLPARSGMGSSSAFTVGLINALSALQGKMPTKRQLAEASIDMEQNVLKEAVGSQDQIAAAFGGFNIIRFQPSGHFDVHPMTIHEERLEELQSHLMLFYTGVQRTSSEVSKSFVGQLEKKSEGLNKMGRLVDDAVSLLSSGTSILEFGKLLREGWETKKSFSADVSNSFVDQLFNAAYSAGALGGKITGAGGGGFLLLFAPPQAHEAIKKRLEKLLYVPFKFDYAGSQVIFADTDADYSAEEEARKHIAIAPFQDLSELLKQLQETVGGSSSETTAPSASAAAKSD